MNMAEKLDEIQNILLSTELCAEAMVSEIENIIWEEED